MLRFSTSVNFLFGELPFLDRFAAARRAGFHGVEIQFLEASAVEVARAAREAGVEIVLLNLDMGDLFTGGPGISGVPGRETMFIGALDAALDAAQETAARCLHFGPSRVPAGAGRAECLATYRANIDAALAREPFTSGRVQGLLEPMNAADMPDALFTEISRAAEFVRGGFGGRLGLQFDVYHVAKSGADVVAAWQDCRDCVRHVQFSDVPGRGEPGSGTLDFPAIFAAIEGSGYAGWLGAEYFPARPTVETLGWLRREYQ
jgi:hydroxypyruvate isomerase